MLPDNISVAVKGSYKAGLLVNGRMFTELQSWIKASNLHATSNYHNVATTVLSFGATVRGETLEISKWAPGKIYTFMRQLINSKRQQQAIYTFNYNWDYS